MLSDSTELSYSYEFEESKEEEEPAISDKGDSKWNFLNIETETIDNDSLDEQSMADKEDQIRKKLMEAQNSLINNEWELIKLEKIRIYNERDKLRKNALDQLKKQKEDLQSNLQEIKEQINEKEKAKYDSSRHHHYVSISSNKSR